jgi:hypothetical protein
VVEVVGPEFKTYFHKTEKKSEKLTVPHPAYHWSALSSSSPSPPPEPPYHSIAAINFLNI